MTIRLRAIGAIAASLALGACSIGDMAGNLAGSAVGGKAGELARASIGGALDAATQMQVRFSPEQEYYLGRAAAAEILGTYGLDPNETNQEYVRQIGASIVALSGRLTETFGGYHFAVLDDEQPNGWSAPGGFVFITRGALARCKTEDEVAGILCHELGHVSLKHGENIIVRGRQAGALAGMLGRVAGAAAGNQGVANNTQSVLGDAGRTMATELVRNGYGNDAEFEADREGTFILYDVGYDAASIRDYIAGGPQRSSTGWSNHPPAADRIARLDDPAKRYGGFFDGDDPSKKAARTTRFERVMAGGAVSSGAEMPVDGMPIDGEMPLEEAMPIGQAMPVQPIGPIGYVTRANPVASAPEVPMPLWNEQDFVAPPAGAAPVVAPESR